MSFQQWANRLIDGSEMSGFSEEMAAMIERRSAEATALVKVACDGLIRAAWHDSPELSSCIRTLMDRSHALTACNDIEKRVHLLLLVEAEASRLRALLSADLATERVAGAVRHVDVLVDELDDVQVVMRDVDRHRVLPRDSSQPAKKCSLVRLRLCEENSEEWRAEIEMAEFYGEDVPLFLVTRPSGAPAFVPATDAVAGSLLSVRQARLVLERLRKVARPVIGAYWHHCGLAGAAYRIKVQASCPVSIRIPVTSVVGPEICNIEAQCSKATLSAKVELVADGVTRLGKMAGQYDATQWRIEESSGWVCKNRTSLAISMDSFLEHALKMGDYEVIKGPVSDEVTVSSPPG